MSFFSHMTLRAKIIGAFTLITLAALLLGLFSIWRLGEVQGYSATMGNRFVPSEVVMGDIINNASRVRIRQGSTLMAQTPAAQAKELKALNESIAATEAARAKYDKFVDAEERPLYDKWTDGWTKYLAQNVEMMRLADSGDKEAANAYFLGEMRVSFRDDFMVALQADMDYIAKSAAADAASGAATYKEAMLWNSVIMILAVGMSMGACLFYVRGVSAPIRAITENMGRLAKHDLTIEIVGLGRHDEVGKMAAAVQVFKQSMIDEDRLRAQTEAETRHNEERARHMAELAQDFDSKVGEVVQSVSA